jgi:hypothetical protein
MLKGSISDSTQKYVSVHLCRKKVQLDYYVSFIEVPGL